MTTTLLAASALLISCAAPRYQPPSAVVGGVGPALVVPDKSLPAFAGSNGSPIGATDLIDALAWADVIILGERHNDGVAHAAQLEIMKRVLSISPRCALAMEMLERDEQPLVDDYLDGIINQATMEKETFSSKWGGEEGSWINWYQPIIDAAKDQGAAVTAANAPRRYVRLATRSGYDRLRALDEERRELFDLPIVVPSGKYVDRFREVMSSHPTGSGDDKSDQESAPPEPTEPPPIRTARDAEQLFGGQLIWDATMAESVAEALRRGSRKVVLLVGQFHIDFEGGLVQELRARRPAARMLTISFQPVDAVMLRDKDRDRADIVIYTGEVPTPEPKPEKETSEPAPVPDPEQKPGV